MCFENLGSLILQIDAELASAKMAASFIQQAPLVVSELLSTGSLRAKVSEVWAGCIFHTHFVMSPILSV